MRKIATADPWEKALQAELIEDHMRGGMVHGETRRG